MCGWLEGTTKLWVLPPREWGSAARLWEPTAAAHNVEWSKKEKERFPDHVQAHLRVNCVCPSYLDGVSCQWKPETCWLLNNGRLKASRITQGRAPVAAPGLAALLLLLWLLLLLLWRGLHARKRVCAAAKGAAACASSTLRQTVSGNHAQLQACQCRGHSRLVLPWSSLRCID